MSIASDTPFKAKLRKDGDEISSGSVVSASGSDIVGGSAGLAEAFSFTTPVKKARIVKHPDCTAEFTILINATGVTASNWHEVMGVNERRLTIDLEGLDINSIQVWSDTDATYGEDFAIYGWN